jgi:pyrroloquinoline quinone biosynthesis protein B
LFPVPARVPTHIANLAKPGRGATVGVRVTDTRSGHRLVVLPSLTRLEPGALAELAAADCRFVDGTFWRADELRVLRPGAPDAFAMGHVPISGPGGSLEALAGLRGRTLYFHVNGTNPILDRASPEAAALRRAGLEIASDGLELET